MSAQSQVTGDMDARPPLIVLVAGAAGSGKTTLGRALARELGLPILDLDQLTNPLLDTLTGALPGEHWLSGPHAAEVRRGRYAALVAAAADIAGLPMGAVLVAPFTAELRGGDEWRALSSSLPDTTIEVVHVDGSPELLAERRQARGEARDAHRLAGPPAVTPGIPHLRVEAALSTHQQLQRVLQHLGRREPIDPSSPLFGATFDAVLFDLDGTLIDSTPAVLRSWRRLAQEYTFDPAEVQTNHGQPARALLERLLAPELVPAAALRIEQLESADTGGVAATPGATELFASLPDPARAIVTSGTRLIATSRLAAAGFPLPAVFVTADDITRGKPDPEPYLLAATRLGVDPARCLVVEDAPAGIRSARAAGCSVLAVSGTADPAELDADLFVDALDRVRLTPAPGGGFTLAPAL
ncbi:HAD-IA family hydrolase [Subtercola sp. YIM 133946]|uniref:HAD-IA family hydrolase n=1 Tax=Subtercola sp. YIM 133946 TaxID=3118909 RepID=UPI002F95CC02